MTSDRKMRAVAIDGVASEVEVALAIPCFILCAMGPQMGNFTCIVDVLLPFIHINSSFFVRLVACRHTPAGERFGSGKTVQDKSENLQITGWGLRSAGNDSEGNRGTEGEVCLLFSRNED